MSVYISPVYKILRNLVAYVVVHIQMMDSPPPSPLFLSWTLYYRLSTKYRRTFRNLISYFAFLRFFFKFCGRWCFLRFFVDCSEILKAVTLNELCVPIRNIFFAKLFFAKMFTKMNLIYTISHTRKLVVTLHSCRGINDETNFSVYVFYLSALLLPWKKDFPVWK
jgi:hypothetical protein